MALFIPTYFSPIAQYAKVVTASTVSFETEDNYQKQSYRNRCYIYNTNGKQLLNIPVKHPATAGRKKTRDAKIDNDTPWQDQHFKSLKTAYKNSPFYEFYIDDIKTIFNKKFTYLQDLNIATFLVVCDSLQINNQHTLTKNYMVQHPNDFRYLADAKTKHNFSTAPYIQMFDDKHGFIPNLSILDLIFMEGPNAISFLDS